MEIVSGGVDWGEVGVGLASIGLGLGIAGTPVGWVGAIGAGIFTYWGGVAVGDGLIEGDAFDGDEE